MALSTYIHQNQSYTSAKQKQKKKYQIQIIIRISTKLNKLTDLNVISMSDFFASRSKRFPEKLTKKVTVLQH